MSATFTATSDPDRDLIELTLAGFFDTEATGRFQAACRDAHARLRCRPNEHDCVVDVCNLMLQSQETVEAFRGIVLSPMTRARRMAIVTGNAAVRMQIRRFLFSGRVRCFGSHAEAWAWLRMPPEEAIRLAG